MRTFIPAVVIPRIGAYNLTHLVYGFHIVLIYNLIIFVGCSVKVLQFKHFCEFTATLSCRCRTSLSFCWYAQFDHHLAHFLPGNKIALFWANKGEESCSFIVLDTSEVSATEVSATEVSITEVSTTEVSVTEVSISEVSTPEVSSTEVSVTEVSSAEVCTTEVCTPEVSTSEVSTSEVSTTEISTTEVSTAEVSTSEVSVTEVSTTEVCTTEVSTTEVSTHFLPSLAVLCDEVLVCFKHLF